MIILIIILLGDRMTNQKFINYLKKIKFDTEDLVFYSDCLIINSDNDYEKTKSEDFKKKVLEFQKEVTKLIEE